ncbi:cytochrome P450 [Streptomyces violascens]|uniref:cytochrome P450 n=1 Tax=Streptomyces violascens TaxID=67381 RepID=UPI00364F3F3C
MESSTPSRGNSERACTPPGVTGRMRRTDPLALLSAEFDGVHDVWRSASGAVCVAGPEAARDVLGNRDATVAETSDFYRTRRGVFGPRDAQVQIARSARALLRRHLDLRRPDLPGLVAERLVPTSVWPDAGNLLVFQHLRDALLRRDAPDELHAVVAEIVARAVLAGARARHSAPSRLIFRRRAQRTLLAEITARRAALRQARPAGQWPEARDLLDVVLEGSGPMADPRDLVEVYLSFLFATAGSIGFALGWSVYLSGMHPNSPTGEPSWTVREALRLWPVAWLFGRTPSRVHDLGGTTVTPRDQLAVCTYLVHRHPGHWERPDEFVPERWADPAADPAFLPFGHGPHSCAGATVAMRLLEDLVHVITRDWHLSVAPVGDGPHVGPSLAPPRFTAVLSARADRP